MKYSIKVEISNRFYVNGKESNTTENTTKELNTVLIKKSIIDLDFEAASTVLAIKSALAEKYSQLDLFDISLKVKEIEKTDNAEVITDTHLISYTATTGVSYEEAPKVPGFRKAQMIELEEKNAAKAAERAANPVPPTEPVDLKAQWKAFRAQIK